MNDETIQSMLLKTEKLTKFFGEISAADGIDLGLGEGTLTSIIGPNGAGKTTFINLVTGYMKPDSGRVFFRGRDITKLSIDKRVKMGLCRTFQLMNIFPQLTVYKNILIPILSRTGRTLKIFTDLNHHSEALSEGRKILEDIGLWEKRELLAGKLSHGEQRLLDLYIAIALNPKLIFLDEPTAGLSPAERKDIVGYLRNMSRQKITTFVVIEHDLDVVFSISDRVIVMDKGRIIADGTPSQIKRSERVREVYLGEEF